MFNKLVCVLGHLLLTNDDTLYLANLLAKDGALNEIAGDDGCVCLFYARQLRLLARISGGAPANRDVNALNGIHPISNIEYKAFSTLNDAGFEFYESDEICDIEENFYTLNFSKLHPSLGIEDSFYVNVRGKASLLRTHTTSSLAKALSSTKPEFRRFTLGKVYRNDNSPKHLAFFTQVEGVICERAANLSKVVALVNYFICEILSAHAQIRIRRTSFPFTEPSVEIDLCCGKQFSSFKHDYNWLEVAGLGLVKQKVLTNLYSNFRNVYAFGLGLERLAMLKFNINNIRKFYTGLVL